MAKKNSEDEAMAEEVERTEAVEAGEQIPLMDVGPENKKVIVDAVRVYKKHQKDRLAALKKEVDQKDIVKSLIKESKLKRNKDGAIVFKYNNVTIKVTPQDDLITINEKKPKKSKKAKKK